LTKTGVSFPEYARVRIERAVLTSSSSTHGGDLTCSAASRNAGALVATIVGVSGVLVTFGWLFGVHSLQGRVYGLFIAPNSALILILASASILLQLTTKRALHGLGVAIGVFVALFGGACLVQRFVGYDFGVDRFFLASSLHQWTVPGVPPGRIAAPTALAAIFIGIALVSLRWKRSFTTDAASSLTSTIAYVAVLGYIYGSRPFYGYIMSLPTAVLVLTIGVALFLSGRHSALRAVVFSSNAGGILLRRLSPLILGALPLMGWIRLRWLQYADIPVEFGTVVFVVATVLLFAITTVMVAATLNRVDEQRKVAQAALMRTEKLAVAGRLAATVAHEVNNPLAGALNAIYLARTSPEMAPQMLEAAERELTRVAAVARQSLGFYRGHSKPQPVPVRIALGEVVTMFRAGAAAKSVTLEITGNSTLSVFADPGELRQVITNLVANAVDATPSGGHIELGARACSFSEVEICVQDTGSGIPLEAYDQVFEPFFTTKPNVGTGLGLFVTKDLVQKNGGKVRFESSTALAKSGTKFFVVLPLATQTSTKEAAAS
jgi:signal transduction histidine kinase